MSFQPEAILFIGIQATGKSTFFRERFFRTHLRINLDLLKTRPREEVLLRACLEMKQSFVVDNTNPSRAERARFIEPARTAGFRIVGYFFESRIADAILRNEGRSEAERIPPKGIRGTRNRMELPRFDEGFDELYFVRIEAAHSFSVTEWTNEI